MPDHDPADSTPDAEDGGAGGAGTQHRTLLDDLLREAGEELAGFAAEARRDLDRLGEQAERGLRELRVAVADFLDRDAGTAPPDRE